MKIGDLVAIRFDDSIHIGILTGRDYNGNGYRFIHPDGRSMYENDLPRSRFIPLQLIRSPMGFNLCDIDWHEVTVSNCDDAKKLFAWTRHKDGPTPTRIISIKELLQQQRFRPSLMQVVATMVVTEMGS